MKQNQAVLIINDLTIIDRSRNKTIIDNFSMQIKKGEIVSLIGPSGSGKSTIALTVMGLLPQTLEKCKGQIFLDGEKLSSKKNNKNTFRGKEIAMIFQDPMSSLNPVLNCGLQAEEALRIHTTMTRKERYQCIIELFKEVDFNEPERIYHSLPAELSGGQLQRIVLAMSVAIMPSVILADEPTTALDPVSQKRIIRLLKKLSQHYQIAIVLISHDRNLVENISHRILSLGPQNQSEILKEDYQLIPTHFKDKPQGVLKNKTEVLKIKGLSKNFTYKKSLFNKQTVTVLNNLNLTIHQGEVVGVVGQSGSGKTTLGRCIAGLTTICQGDIQIKTTKINPVQMIYQNPSASLNPLMTIGESIGEGLVIKKLPEAEVRLQVLQLLKQVGLPESYYYHYPKELSGGEKQRVVIARAVAVQPVLLIADEPTASLDTLMGDQVMTLLLNLVNTMNLSILLISHDHFLINNVSDHFFHMKNGKLSQQG